MMKLKIQKKPRSGETIIDYFRVDDKNAFRFEFIKQAMHEAGSEMILTVCTAASLQKGSAEALKAYLENSNIYHETLMIPAAQDKILGIPVDGLRKNKLHDSLFVLRLCATDFTAELFQNLKAFDIAVGFQPQKSFMELTDLLRIDRAAPFFDKKYFLSSLFDSIICVRIRVSYDVDALIAALKGHA